MLLRWVSALIGIAVFVSVCLWGVVPFAAGVTVLAALALCELARSWRARGVRVSPLLAASGLIAPAWPLISRAVRAHVPPALVLLLVVALIWEVVRAGRTGELRAGEGVANGLLLGVYAALFGGLSALREAGVAVVLASAICVWTTDSAAFFVGKALGRRKLAPALSPAKTVEGALGGAIGALAMGAAVGVSMVGSWRIGLLIGAVAGVLGQMGDLFESALKREAGVKDFGTILPGHGGVLDRFDSLLFVAPALAAALSLLGR